MLNYKLGFLTDKTYLGTDELIGFQSPHNHFIKSPHVLLKLSYTFHIEVRTIGPLFNCIFETRVEIEETHQTLEGTLSVKGLSICCLCCLDQLCASEYVELLGIDKVQDASTIIIKFISPPKQSFSLKNCLDHVELFDCVQKRYLCEWISKPSFHIATRTQSFQMDLKVMQYHFKGLTRFYLRCEECVVT